MTTREEELELTPEEDAAATAALAHVQVRELSPAEWERLKAATERARLRHEQREKRKTQ